jgi:hypothetical protein
MPASAFIQYHEERIAFLPTEQLEALGPWTLPQQRLLAVLQHKEHRYASIAKICRLAGYAGNTLWYEAMKDERFVAVIRALGIKRSPDDLKRWQQQLLEVVQHPENRNKSGAQICRLAGYKDHGIWQRAMKDRRFVAERESLGVTIRKHHLPSHLEVEPVTNVEEELAKDVWDLRRLKHDYPKHVAPTTYEVDFSWIINPVLREQVKRYFRLRLTGWRAGTFKRALYHLKTVLILLPPDVLDQFDPLLEQAEQAMKEGQEPSILAPIFWDALLILRHTGMRFEDLAHLKAPDEHGRNGCLDQDSEGYWWLRIEYVNTKMGRDHRIPTRKADGVIDAIRRKPGAGQAASGPL